MIRFDLTCDNAHSFDSWFRSGDDCTNLLERGMVNCTECGSSTVRKALMAPKVSSSVAAPARLREPGEDSPLARFKKEMESKADDVGTNFAAEARAMHDGSKPERLIYGQASGAEAKKLLSDGIPVLPLPFIPSKKTN